MTTLKAMLSWHRRRWSRAALRKVMAASLVTLGVHGAASAAFAQDYPNKPIRMVVGFAPGGGSDLTARLVADALSTRLGQTVVVENRAGAGSTIAADLVAKARPDGYTIFWCSSDSQSIAPALKPSLPYKVPDAFSYIARVTGFDYVIATYPGVPFKTMPEMIAYAKANPGKIRYGTSGVGSGPHMAAEILSQATGIQMEHIPYNGTGPGMTALVAGQIEIVLGAPAPIQPFAEAGSVRVIGSMGNARHPNYPAAPTMAESGLGDIVVTIWYGLVTPAGTPDPIIARLRKEVGEIAKDPKIAERLNTLGFLPMYMDGDAFRDYIVKDMVQWADIVKKAKITLE